MNNLNQRALEIDLMISQLVDAAPGISHAAVVSTYGQPLATSLGLTPEQAVKLASRAGDLLRDAWAAAKVFEAGAAHQAVIEMQDGVLIVVPITDALGVAVLAAPECEPGTVAWHIAHVANNARKILIPETQE